MLNLDAATAAKEHTGCHSCHLTTGNWGLAKLDNRPSRLLSCLVSEHQHKKWWCSPACLCTFFVSSKLSFPITVILKFVSLQPVSNLIQFISDINLCFLWITFRSLSFTWNFVTLTLKEYTTSQLISCAGLESLAVYFRSTSHLQSINTKLF